MHAMALVVEHSKMTTAVVELLSKCIQSAIDNRKDELQRNFDLLRMKEVEADALRRKIIDELARGELSTDNRVGLMRLARQADWIADCAHGAARALLLFDLSQMPKLCQDMALEMSNILAESTAKVASCVQKLMDGELTESLKLADDVEYLEEKVDKLYQQSRSEMRDIQTNGTHVGSIILLAQFLDGIEKSADGCEDTCDQARVMAVMLSKKRD